MLALGVFPPAFLMGGAFPYFVRLGLRRSTTIGAAFGQVSAANIAGGVAGSLLAPFVLLPGLGLAAGVLACAALNGLLGTALLARRGGRRAWLEVGLAAAVAATAGYAALSVPASPSAAHILRVPRPTKSGVSVIWARPLASVSMNAALTNASLPVDTLA